MVNREVELEIDKLCRCCMSEKENMQDMFEEKNIEERDSVALPEMLKICAAIDVEKADSLPNNLCGICKDRLKSCYEFRQQCQQTDSVLRQLAQNETTKIVEASEEKIEVQLDLKDTFDEEDDVPLLALKDVKRKRGRPKKLEEEIENVDFPCLFCNKVLNSKKGLKVHLKVHSSEKPRQCLFCDAKYTRINHLVRHINTHDKPGLYHPCKKCDLSFVVAMDLFKHFQEHEGAQASEEEEIKVEKQELILELSQEVSEPKNRIEDFAKEDPEQDVGGSYDDVFEEHSTSDVDVADIYDMNSDSEYQLEDEKKPKGKKGRKKQGYNDGKMYQCKECSKVMTTFMGYKIHMRKHNGTDLATCKLCYKVFTKQSHLTRHMKTHGIVDEEQLKELQSKPEDKVKRVMECDYCDRKFKYRKSFVHHMQSEHGMSDGDSDIEKTAEDIETKNDETEMIEGEDVREMDTSQGIKIEMQNSSIEAEDAELLEPNLENLAVKKSRAKNQVCHVCGATFARVNHLTRHMILHRSLLVHQCDKCDKAFAKEEFLKQHEEEEHINKPYVCTVCNKPFGRGEHLIRHLKVHQATPAEKEASLKCSICDLSFSRSDHLARHTKIHLLQDKRHVCTECGKAFNRLDNLRTHQRIHTGIKDAAKLHLCIYCGKEFNNSSNMIVHMRRHTGERPYKCNECGKGFPRSHDLKCHERTHSGEKPYLCTLCGKSFNKSNKLLRHSRVHTGERPYVCNICGRAFTQSNDLALHMRRHTGARPYACGVCPARFIQSGQLKTHRRTTGHWMDTQPDLKGGHRVEPVTPAHEPMPIRFKSHKLKKEETVDNVTKPEEQHHLQGQQLQHPEQETPMVIDLQPPPRILMGIMSNIKIPNDVPPLLIDGSKLVELHLPTVIQASNGEEIKLKSEVGSFTITQDGLGKQEEDPNGVYQDATVIYSTVEHTATTYTSSETFNFQNYH